MKVCIHPGYVRSKYDHDEHYIGVSDLVKLYGIRKDDEVRICERKNPMECEANFKDYIHLYPSFEGDYFDVHLLRAKDSK